MLALLRRLGYRWITQVDAADRLKQATAGMTPPKPCVETKKVRSFKDWTERDDRRQA